MTQLTEEQVEVLLRPIAPHRVKKTPEGFSHVEAYDIRAMLNRIFGFAQWSLIETTPATCVVEKPHELRNKKPGVKVAYRAHMTIEILATGARYSGSAVGEATMPDYLVGDAHDMALKTAESGALKRAASNLGDQFGLSLYNDGSTQAIVRKVVGHLLHEATKEELQVQDPAGETHTTSPRGRADGASSAPTRPRPEVVPGGGDVVKTVMKEISALDAEARKRVVTAAVEERITVSNAMSVEDAHVIHGIIQRVTKDQGES